ncbi:MAG TPA: 50S ribosomal protein L11 methyltransferase [Candidatus Limnocylindrales bacterium]|nr:50S ribosomal protein L11 methyltransferase [Candidatus Limnocylindrales bacterium]
MADGSGPGADPGLGDVPGPPDDEGLSAGDTWIELSVRADLEAVEAVSEILSRFAPGGTSVEPGFELVDEGLGARVDPNRPAIVRAYLPGRDRSAARIAVRAAREALGHLQAFDLRPIGEIEVSVVHEADWAHAWKAHFPVLRIGRRLVIRPTWRRHRRQPGDVVLALDPGMAFGTGLHPTTRLCLAGIEHWSDSGLVTGARLLDVGCGSGILMIAAGLFGASELVGLDTDPIAVEASAANARRNKVPVEVRSGSLPSRQVPFDLIAANLIASVLIALAAALHAELRPGGRLLASGIFIDREGDVRAAFETAGLRQLGRTGEGDWVALELERPAG